jgi:hypothetical protein
MTPLTRISLAETYPFGFDFTFFLGGFFGIAISVARILTPNKDRNSRPAIGEVRNNRAVEKSGSREYS